MNSSQQAAPVTPISNGNSTKQTLPMIGELGSSALLNALTSSANPLQAIIQFRTENGLHTPKTTVESFRPVIELNDLQGNPRRTFYKDILDNFLAKMLAKCPTLSPEQRHALLTECFPYIGFKELQKLPFTLLELTPKIPVAFLHQLSTKQDLYEQSPLAVQRQIWEVHPNLFLKKVQPIFDSYSKSRFVNLPAFDNFVPLQARRDNTPELKQLADLIGESFLLYQRVIEYCLALYLRTGYHHYSTLRTELLLYFREINILSIFVSDPCSKFVMIIRNCVGANNIVNHQKVKELATAIKDLPSGSPLRGEYAMILSDPNISNLFVKNIFGCLKEVVENLEEFSDFRKHDKVNYLTCCVDLGLNAHAIIRENLFKKHSPGKGIFVTFYGQLIHRIVDDQLREPSDNPPELPNELIKYFFSEAIARKILLYYTVQRAASEDINSVKQLLQLVEGSEGTLNAEQAFLHSLATIPALTQNAELQKLIIDDFFLPRNAQLIVHVEILEFLMNANARLPAIELLKYLEQASKFRAKEENEANFVLSFATRFSERVSSRVNPTNAPFFFVYLECLKDPKTFDDVWDNVAAAEAISSIADVSESDIVMDEPHETSNNDNQEEEISDPPNLAMAD